MVKNLLAMLETQVPSLSQEDPLEKGMATHSSLLAWRILCTEEPGGLQSMGSQRVRHNWATKAFTQTSFRLPVFPWPFQGPSQDPRSQLGLQVSSVSPSLWQPRTLFWFSCPWHFFTIYRSVVGDVIEHPSKVGLSEVFSWLYWSYGFGGK